MIKSYGQLPDYMSCEELESCFQAILKEPWETNNILINLDNLYELADRQWHTYTMLKPELLNRIQILLFSVTNFENPEIIDYLLDIIPRLGLNDLFQSCLKQLPNIKNQDVINSIREADKEFGSTVADPYSGMKT